MTTTRRGPAAGPYGVLQVWDRLEVGPVCVEPTRLVTRYRVVAGDAVVETTFTCRYEESLFDDGPVSANLAALIGAQPALNYTLFAREVRFHGPFSQADRTFLRDAAENTAREILVKKFLEPNPFLVEPWDNLPAVRQRRISQAELLFDEPAVPECGSGKRDESHRYLVLSSGGKESLLTYGLLNELGAEVHPVYVNESGRHWYTALNGYRHFARNVPHTARIWTDVDRLYNWALRHLPMVRKDYQSLRADEYPIRLWTVPVMVFATLPIAFARGLDRILVGDEFDTTRRATHEGIPHYDGLYDQSRYFDNAMCRYYRRKGWAQVQFSILRPLSEFLVQEMVALRYPELQAQQVSCHAAHVEGERVVPCGKCEKCRRVVGMLVAAGSDPRRCGYSDAQVEHALEALSGRPLHQEQAGFRFLVRRLVERGRLPGALSPKRTHPEVHQLRFDREHAPPDWIPRDLREPLFRLWLEHADGAVRRLGRQWVPVDPLAPEFLAPPFQFERAPDRSSGGEGGSDFLLGEMTWPEAERRFREVDVALLPVGAVEQHGPHLPVDTDAWDADHTARMVAARCSQPRPIVLPLIPYGVSYHHADFPGTIPVSPDTLAAMVREVGMAAAANGIRKLVIINGHGGNMPALHFAAQLINRDARIFTCVESGETSDADVARLAETTNDVHAGEIETSTALASRPHLVHMERAEAFVPSFSSKYLDFSSQNSVEWYARTARISPTGVLGDPTRATAAKGQAMWQAMIDHLVAFVEELKGQTLAEIHQRRY